MIESNGYIPPEAEAFRKTPEVIQENSALEQGEEFIRQLNSEDSKPSQAPEGPVGSSVEEEWAQKKRQEYIRNGFIFWGSATATGAGLIYGANRLSEEFLAPIAEKVMQTNPESFIGIGIAAVIGALALEMGARSSGASFFFPYRR